MLATLKNSSLSIHSDPQGNLTVQLTVSKKDIPDLVARIERALQGKDGILRFDPIPGKGWVHGPEDQTHFWTLYLKSKEGDPGSVARGMVAHAEKNEWVGTFVLHPTHWSEFLGNIQRSDSFSSQKLFSFGRANNLHWHCQISTDLAG